MRQIVIGTAGHVDHGKTSLVHALTNVKTDRLPEEKRRGITIELGFAPWRISDDEMVSIIDAPGHRRLVHHMIAGASGIDLVLLIVAGDEGVMPQTREHIAACRLLGIKHAIIVITKIDRADRELAELAGEEARDLVEEQGLEATVAFCSSITGEGIDDLRATVLKKLDSLVRPEREHRVRLSVDRVFTMKGAGTVITGTLVTGKLREGDTLRLLSTDRELETAARGLHVHGSPEPEAHAPTRLAINLANLTVDDVHRGDVITSDQAVRPTRLIDAWVEVDRPIKRGAEASMFVGTARSVVKVQPVGDSNALTESGYARLRLKAPMVTFGGDRFVLRGAQIDGPAGGIIGGGVVLDAHAPRNVRARKRFALLEALHDKEPASAMMALAKERAPRPIEKSTLGSRFCLGADELSGSARQLVKDGLILPVLKKGWVHQDAYRSLGRDAITLVAAHHVAAPLEPGLPLQTLREKVTAIAGNDVCAEFFSRLKGRKGGTSKGSAEGDEESLVIEADFVRLASFKGAKADDDERQALESAQHFFEVRALVGASERAFSAELELDQKRARSLLNALSRENLVVRAGDLWFATASVDRLRDQVAQHFATNDEITIATFKEISQLGRKQAIPLLEYFDRTKITKRVGSARVPGSAITG